MELEEYLERLKTCPEGHEKIFDRDRGIEDNFEKLTLLYGIYDNYYILFRASYEKIMSCFLKRNDKYKLKLKDRYYEDIGHKYSVFIHIPHSCDIQVHDGLYYDWGIDHLISMGKEFFGEEESKFGLNIRPNYPRNILINWPDEGGEVSFNRAIANAIIDVGQLLIEENIPACFSHTKHTDARIFKGNSDNYIAYKQSVVFFEPES